MTNQAITDLTKRLSRLETQNRMLRKAVCGVILSAVAVFFVGAGQVDKRQADSFDTLRARRVVIGDSNGRDRLILELESGEPTLKMFNHHGHRQIFLGINEQWDDTAYLSVSSRLENGDVDKQAVLAVTSSRPKSPGNSQLVLYDAKPGQKDAARRHLVRLSSGLTNQKPYLEMRESPEKGASEVNPELLRAEPTTSGRRVLLDTNSEPPTLSGVRLKRKRG